MTAKARLRLRFLAMSAGILTGLSAMEGSELPVTTQATIRWDPPTRNTDGSLLTNLGGFNLYIAEGTQAFGYPWDIGTQTSYEFFGYVTVPVYRIGATAYNTQNAESEMSLELYWAPVPDADTNDNGVPDSWEVLMFGTLDPPDDATQTDHDRDGHSNLEEYIAGTDPRDPRDVLAARFAARVEEEFLFTFEAREAAGIGYEGTARRYTVQRLSGDLRNANAWENMAGYTDIPGAGQTVTVTEGVGRQPGPVFYRVTARLVAP